MSSSKYECLRFTPNGEIGSISTFYTRDMGNAILDVMALTFGSADIVYKSNLRTILTTPDGQIFLIRRLLEGSES